jgi:hypothetical protein
LKYRPNPVIRLSIEVLFLDPIVDSAAVAPHPSRTVLVRIDLEEKKPYLLARVEFGYPRILVVDGIATVDAIRGKLTLIAHVPLNGILTPP